VKNFVVMLPISRSKLLHNIYDCHIKEKKTRWEIPQLLNGSCRLFWHFANNWKLVFLLSVELQFATKKLLNGKW